MPSGGRLTSCEQTTLDHGSTDQKHRCQVAEVSLSDEGIALCGGWLQDATCGQEMSYRVMAGTLGERSCFVVRLSCDGQGSCVGPEIVSVRTIRDGLGKPVSTERPTVDAGHSAWNLQHCSNCQTLTTTCTLALHRMRLKLETPLLTKELGEQALQARTYLLRGLYGILLYLGGLLLIYGGGGTINAQVSLGQGLTMFWNIVYLEAFGILLFLPAMSAGSLAGEKERESLSLLLLTTLPPWSILWQKLLSRLIPMLTLVILSFPLLAAAYSFGGVPTDDLLWAGVLLVLWTIQIAALSLACSSFCRTTVAALVSSYVLAAVIFLLFSILSSGRPTVFSYFPFAYGQSGFRLNTTPQGVIRCVVLFGVLMFASRIFLFTRAFTPASNALLKVFQSLDRFWNEMNGITGGIVLVDDGNRWPHHHPVAWRETSKKSLGTFRYLFRILIVIETPILFGCQMANLNHNSNHQSISVMLFTTWAIGTALICVHAASVISGERARQTLETLLTTPLSGSQIILEKLSGVRRLVFVLLVPLCTVIGFQHWFRDFHWDLNYVSRSLALSAVFLWLLMWMCCWYGLRMKSQLRSIVASMVTVIVLLALPIVCSFLLVNVLGWTAAWCRQIALISPATLIGVTEAFDAPSLLATYGVDLNHQVWFWSVLTGWAGVALALRVACLSNADGALGRVPAAALQGETSGQVSSAISS